MRCSDSGSERSDQVVVKVDTCASAVRAQLLWAQHRGYRVPPAQQVLSAAPSYVIRGIDVCLSHHGLVRRGREETI